MSVRARHASGVSSRVAGIRSESHRFKSHVASLARVVVAFPLVLCSPAWESLGAEDSPPSPANSQIEETNSQALLHAYLRLQEQLHATQLAIEQNRQETKAAAAQNAEALSNGLQTIQQAFSAQRAQDLDAMRRSNQIMLIVVGTFAAIGLLTMLITTYFQWRMSKGLAEISAALPTALGLGNVTAAAAIVPAEESNLRLLGALEQVEKHTRELERSPHPALKHHAGTGRSIESRLFPAPGDSFRRRQFRALKVAVIVGLISAAGLALLLYVVTSRKLGFG